MSVLLYGIGLFVLAVLLHLLIWRIHLPENQASALLYIFFGIFIVAIFIFRRNPAIAFFGIPVPATICENLQFSFLFISLTSAYIANYPAIEVDSPSLIMIMDIARAYPAGLDRDTFKKRLNNDNLIMPRINDLLKGKFIYLKDGRYRLTRRGLFIARIFILFRRILGMRQLGG